MPSDANDTLAKAFDALARARARQQVSEFVENAEGAAYHAETAVKTMQLIKDILDMKDKTLVAAIVAAQGEQPKENK